jgi:DNA (cytosine-5)-methyltransferase 1
VSNPVLTPCSGQQPGMILDLFAGAGGWEQALATLGLGVLGIETDRWACETARAAGHDRLQADAAELGPLSFGPVWGLVGSPPCQAYSTAGKGLGRLDKPLLVACAHELAAGKDDRRAWREGCRDSRSLLTVEPLRYALALRPRWIALEQVPAVLELWSVFTGLLGACDYHTAAGVLSAERYGVPQTRKRAFLIASLDGPVSLPAPTHRLYNPRRAKVSDDERDLLPWVSMAEALGWVLAPVCDPGRVPIVQTRRGGKRITEGIDPSRAPSPTLTTRANRWQAHGVIQGSGWAWRNGERAHACVRRCDSPAPTIIAQAVPTWTSVPASLDARQRGARPRPIREPAPTMLAAGLSKGVPVWTAKRSYRRCRDSCILRVTVRQAAVLQGFPADYPWQGSQTRQFEQVGNAVPPPLARRVLEEAIRPGGGW